MHWRSDCVPGISAEAAASAARNLLLCDGLTVQKVIGRLHATGLFRVRVRELMHSNGRHSALTTTTKDGFEVVVDPRPHWPFRYSEADQPPLEAVYRLAHEVGHTFFYDLDCSPPRRRTAVTQEEEAFADEFALHLLVPQALLHQSVFDAESIVGTARRLHLPRWLVATGAVRFGLIAAAAEWTAAGTLLWDVGDKALVHSWDGSIYGLLAGPQGPMLSTTYGCSGMRGVLAVAQVAKRLGTEPSFALPPPRAATDL